MCTCMYVCVHVCMCVCLYLCHCICWTINIFELNWIIHNARQSHIVSYNTNYSNDIIDFKSVDFRAGVGATNTKKAPTKSPQQNARLWLTNAKISANHNQAHHQKPSAKNLLALTTPHIVVYCCYVVPMDQLSSWDFLVLLCIAAMLYPWTSYHHEISSYCCVLLLCCTHGPALTMSFPHIAVYCCYVVPMDLLSSWDFLILLCIVAMSQIAKFMGPTWGPPGYCLPQNGPMWVQWTLL